MDGLGNSLKLRRAAPPTAALVHSADASAARFSGLLTLVALLALAVRLYAARYFPDDTPSDARGYERLARNLLEQHVYSSADAAPFMPSAFRMPGYPVFLAGVYGLFGVHANRVVRLLQALADSLTCGLAAWLAWSWAPRDWELAVRRRAAALALLLTAACPFVSVYITTLLTETLTTCAFMLATVMSVRAMQTGRVRLWALAGVACGAATMLRPESGLLLAACAGMLLLTAAARARGWVLLRALRGPALGLGLGFALVLAPWVIRNALTFHAFMPLPPSRSYLSVDADEDGYGAWLNTWVDDFRYVEPLEWRLDAQPIVWGQLPESAFDSAQEKQRVARLIAQYNRELRMTPALDKGFAQLARERRAHHPWRQHVSLPVRRALGLWFDTHSDFFWFAGQLHTWRTTAAPALAWRVLFVALVWLYTLGATVGLYVTRRRRELHTALWFMLLIALPRAWLLGQLENPEPRYMVELFPCVISLCALGLASLVRSTARAR